MRVKVKICGITETEDLLMVSEEGADAVGFIFVEESPRSVSISRARTLSLYTPPFITRVGVFMDESLRKIQRTAEAVGLDAVQLHGTESPSFCLKLKTVLSSSGKTKKGMKKQPGRVKIIKGFRIKDEDSVLNMKRYLNAVDAFLLDTFVSDRAGGTGETFNWDLFRMAREEGLAPLILAGGLTPDNISQALIHTSPFAVDVSSGVERETRRKDPHKTREFISRVNLSGVT